MRRNLVVLAIAAALGAQACAYRTIRWDAKIPNDADATVAKDLVTIRHQGMTLIPPELFVAKQDCLVAGRPMVPESVVVEATRPVGDTRAETHVAIFQKITIHNGTDHIIRPFDDKAGHPIPKIQMTDANPTTAIHKAHALISREEARKLLISELPCAGDVLRPVGKKDAMDRILYLDPDNKGLELLPNTDWDGYAAFDMTPERGGNTGTWRFSYYEFPVGSRSTEVGDIGRTATFDFNVVVKAYIDVYSGLTRQATGELVDHQLGVE